MKMISSLTSSLSGLNAYQTRTSVTANNIANVNTPGYAREVANLSEDSPGVQVSSIQRIPSENPNISSADLAKDMVNLTTDSTAYKANISVIKTQNKMLGDLMDLVA